VQAEQFEDHHRDTENSRFPEWLIPHRRIPGTKHAVVLMTTRQRDLNRVY